MRRARSLLSCLLIDESGQVLPIIGLAIFVLLGIAGLAIDVGHVYLCQRELQASCDAAALAGAAVIPTSTQASTVISTATTYSALTNGKNVYANMTGAAMVPGYPVLKCLATMQTQGISCVGYLPYNALQVREQATVPMYFAKLFGKSSMTVSASSTAAKGGGSSRPYNIAIMLDTTLSMTNIDSDCGGLTQMQCSLNGVQVLLKYLDPCGTSQHTCTIASGNSQNSVVRVSLFTFPQMDYPTASYDSDCSSSTPNADLYSFPLIGAVGYYPGTLPTSTTYRVLDFQSDYRLSDTTTTLNPNSLLTVAVGGKSGCASMGTPNYAGVVGTYYAATMYAAQSALIADQLANPGSQNVLIVLGDGDANAPQWNNPLNYPPPHYNVMPPPATGSGFYPSYYGECGQAIDAATFATGQGTTVYSVAYGSPASGCSTDQSASHVGGSHPNISPCNEMAAIASHSWDFFSDYKQTGSGSTCVAAQTMISLSDIFLQIAGDLTVARLIPDNTT